MGIFSLPASSSGIKSVQRGSAVSAGNVTIAAVNIDKSFVTVFGTASSGTVAATGSLSGATGTTSTFSGTISATTGNVGRVSANQGSLTNSGYGAAIGQNISSTSFNANAQNISLNATNLSGGTNNLVAAVVQGFLANSTTLTVSGPCRYEVVEFN